MRQRWKILGCTIVALFMLGSQNQASSQEKQTKKAADKETAKSASAKTKAIIPIFSLSGSISEAPADEAFSFNPNKNKTLKELVERMQQASKDATVKALVVLPQDMAAGWAQVEELRRAIAEVRAAGKEVYAHGDSFSMKEYVLAAGATRISLVPTADLWLTGLHAELPYLRGLLNKLGVQPDFLTCGAYKSAAEIFMREGPSPEADKMENWLLDSLYGTQIKLIASGRHVDAARAKAWIDQGPYVAEKARAAGLIDVVKTWPEFEAEIKTKFGKEARFDRSYGKKKPPSLDVSSPFAMFNVFGELLGESKKKKHTKDAIAVVHVEGPITLGGGDSSPFEQTGARSTTIRRALDEAVRDSSIKALVLRVNSPGGSAVASEVILEATRRVKAKMPLVVSMGDVAASGGYYVSCGSDIIFADSGTITGSIGVVGGKLVTTQMWGKIGVAFKTYDRGANAALLSTESVFSKEEKARMQVWMDDIYGVFKGHVTEIRGQRLKKPIDELAGGRVYTGQQALELGLVDKIGTLNDAVKEAAQRAKLAKYEVRTIPEPKNFLEEWIEEMSGNKEDNRELNLSTLAHPTAARTSLLALAMPYLSGLDPQRIALIRLALGRLQLIQQEGAVLMMPELRFNRR
jgi:protease IV